MQDFFTQQQKLPNNNVNKNMSYLSHKLLQFSEGKKSVKVSLSG